MRVTKASAILAFLALLTHCSGASGPPPGPPPPPPPPANVIRLSGDGQSATVGTTLPKAFVVKVVDSRGGGVSGVTVDWSVTIGPGTLSSNHTITDYLGHDSVTLTLGTTPGITVVSATVGQLAPVVFTTTAVAGP